MLKFLRRLFVRPTVLELLEDDLYETKVQALEAAKNAEYWTNIQATLLQRVKRLEDTQRDEAGVLRPVRKFQEA